MVRSKLFFAKLVKGDFLLFFVFWGTILLQEQEKQKDNKVPIEGKSAWL